MAPISVLAATAVQSGIEIQNAAQRWVAVAKDQEERIVELERVVGEQEDKLKDARENLMAYEKKLKKWSEERQEIAKAIQDIQKTMGMYGRVQQNVSVPNWQPTF